MKSHFSDASNQYILLVFNFSSLTGFQKFFIFTGLILLLYILFKAGQKILVNLWESDEDHDILKLLPKHSAIDGKIDLTMHVADVFLSVLLASVFTAASIYLFTIQFQFSSLYLLFILSIVSGLILFAAIDFLAGIFSSIMIRNARKPVFLTWPFLFAVMLSYPFRKLFERSIKQERIIKRNNLTFSELSDVIEHSEARPEEEQEKELMKGVLNFSDLEVKEIMRSRIDVVTFSKSMPFSEVLRGIVESGYSRFPVIDENLDNIIGILHIKDMLAHITENDDFAWQKHLRPAFFVPENYKINELLLEFQLKKNHLAVIVDEYGGTSGIVTLEDIIEEIVGEIDDEFDTDNDGIVFEKISDHEYIFDGKTSLNDFCKITSYDPDLLEQIKGDAETLAGLILSIEGKFPEYQQKIMFDTIEFTIEAMDDRRIKKVKVVILHNDDNNA